MCQRSFLYTPRATCRRKWNPSAAVTTLDSYITAQNDQTSEASNGKVLLYHKHVGKLRCWPAAIRFSGHSCKRNGRWPFIAANGEVKHIHNASYQWILYQRINCIVFMWPVPPILIPCVLWLRKVPDNSCKWKLYRTSSTPVGLLCYRLWLFPVFWGCLLCKQY